MNSLVKTNDQLVEKFFPFSIGLDNIFDRLSSTSRQNLCDSFPPYNILKSDNKTIIEVALAGYGKDDIKVVVKDGVLSVEGENKRENKDVLHQGIASRKFTRQFSLGEHVEVNSAKLEDGMLTVELEVVLPPEKQPKQIDVL